VRRGSQEEIPEARNEKRFALGKYFSSELPGKTQLANNVKMSVVQ
jgi:hypothetical protein